MTSNNELGVREDVAKDLTLLSNLLHLDTTIIVDDDLFEPRLKRMMSIVTRDLRHLFERMNIFQNELHFHPEALIEYYVAAVRLMLLNIYESTWHALGVRVAALTPSKVKAMTTDIVIPEYIVTLFLPLLQPIIYGHAIFIPTPICFFQQLKTLQTDLTIFGGNLGPLDELAENFGIFIRINVRDTFKRRITGAKIILSTIDYIPKVTVWATRFYSPHEYTDEEREALLRAHNSRAAARSPAGILATLDDIPDRASIPDKPALPSNIFENCKPVIPHREPRTTRISALSFSEAIETLADSSSYDDLSLIESTMWIPNPIYRLNRDELPYSLALLMHVSIETMVDMGVYTRKEFSDELRDADISYFGSLQNRIFGQNNFLSTYSIHESIHDRMRIYGFIQSTIETIGQCSTRLLSYMAMNWNESTYPQLTHDSIFTVPSPLNARDSFYNGVFHITPFGIERYINFSQKNANTFVTTNVHQNIQSTTAAPPRGKSKQKSKRDVPKRPIPLERDEEIEKKAEVTEQSVVPRRSAPRKRRPPRET